MKSEEDYDDDENPEFWGTSLPLISCGYCGDEVHLFRGRYFCDNCGANYDKDKKLLGYTCDECDKEFLEIHRIGRYGNEMRFCDSCLKLEISTVKIDLAEEQDYLERLKNIYHMRRKVFKDRS